MNKRVKIIYLLATSLPILNAHAVQLSCGYRDFFHLSYKKYSVIRLFGHYGDANIISQTIDNRSFTLSDSGHCKAGEAHVTFYYDLSNICILDIKDGPYMNHPTIQANCVGIKYLGLYYDGTGTYSYTVDLEME